MGHRFSRIWRSSEGGMSSSPAENSSDEDDSLAAVLAILRSGNLRLFRSRRFLYEDDSIDATTDAQECEQARFPNTIKESDLYQKILMNQGMLSDINEGTPTVDHNINVAFKLRQREIGSCGFMKNRVFTRGTCGLLASLYVPNYIKQEIYFDEKVFCGTYSADGNAFLSSCQDRHIRIYNTNTMLTTLSPFKDVIAKDVGWSVLDTAFRSDCRYLAYSSWSNFIHLCSVYDGGDTNLVQHKALNLRPDQYNFAVFSLQFTRDGNEILCGANDGYLYVYNLELEQRILKLDAHEDDINAVCFADDSSQILYSGGDDGLVKVWDRRTLSEIVASPVGTLAGHKDGITFIDTLGDARYLLSNSKDQSIKLWDIRKFSSSDAILHVRNAVSNQTWDYRWESVPRRMGQQHKPSIPGDTSVMTYTGHRVLNTLIRARFSPHHSTGNKYIYCGCSTGKVFIYDILTGKVISQRRNHRNCVRDVAWHPFKQEIISSSWDGSIKLWQWDSEGVQ